MSAKGDKGKYFAGVIYPESLPTDWRDQIQKTGLPCVISPLHDHDLNPDGTLKKPHYHIIFVFPNSTTYNNAKKIMDMLGQPAPQILSSIKGYYRYLTHKDNPEKYQYSEDDITLINGFSILDYTELTHREVEVLKRDIIKIIRDNDIIEYSDLINLLIDNEYFDLSDIASNNTIFFNNYISSKRNKQRED